MLVGPLVIPTPIISLVHQGRVFNPSWHFPITPISIRFLFEAPKGKGIQAELTVVVTPFFGVFPWWLSLCIIRKNLGGVFSRSSIKPFGVSTTFWGTHFLGGPFFFKGFHPYFSAIKFFFPPRLSPKNSKSLSLSRRCLLFSYHDRGPFFQSTALRLFPCSPPKGPLSLICAGFTFKGGSPF